MSRDIASMERRAGGEPVICWRQVAGALLLAVLCLLPLQTVRAEVPFGGLPLTEGESGTVRQLKERYNWAYFTNLAVLACAGAYEPDTSPEFAYLAQYGWKSRAYVLRDGRQEVNFTLLETLTERGTPVYMVSFRGSASKGDWQADLTTALVPWRDTDQLTMAGAEKKMKLSSTVPQVHKGFNSYTELVMEALSGSGRFVERKTDAGTPVWDLCGVDGSSCAESETGAVIPELDMVRRLAEHPDAELLLTGHSLGGAVATLAGQRLIDLGVAPSRTHVVTFGAPAVGNRAFAKTYGKRLELLRVTNTADPVPKALQFFFGRYRQFGQEKDFELPRQISNMQHPVDMYMDCSFREYYHRYDKVVTADLMEAWPRECVSDPQAPLVAVWVGSSPQLDKTSYVPDLKRFMEAEYKAMLPNYRIMAEDVNLWGKMGRNPEDFSRKADAADADYILTIEIDGKKIRNTSDWYLTLTQSLWDVKNRKMLLITSAGKRTSRDAGNVVTAMKAVQESRGELLRNLPWLAEAQQPVPEKFHRTAKP